MKISLLTIWRVKNFGAEMQAYATVKMLQSLGHEVNMIDFRLSDNDKSLKKCLERIVFYLCIGNYKLLRFWSKYIPTTKRYKSVESLCQNPPKSDVYIVGSDQVWNPEITKKVAQLFFLNFGKDNIRRVSYASSFGSSDWADDILVSKLVEEHLSKFDAVSCRESSGVGLLSQRFNIQSTNVLDPTLLFESYPELIGEPNLKTTLAYYPLAPFPQLESFAIDLAREIGLEYTNINAKKYIFNSIVWNRSSIEDWVKNIAESSLVVTHSFHGLAFSLIYSRQFIIVASETKRSARITDLLSQLGLEDRYFTCVEDAQESKIWERQIDYSEVKDKLSVMRNNSINYLKNALR